MVFYFVVFTSVLLRLFSNMSSTNNLTSSLVYQKYFDLFSKHDPNIQHNRNSMTDLEALLNPFLARSGLDEFVHIKNTSQSFYSHCDTCAVVSSSGILLNSSAGDLIDGHICVFRMNNHASAKFEKDVGQRTTHRYS